MKGGKRLCLMIPALPDPTYRSICMIALNILVIVLEVLIFILKKTNATSKKLYREKVKKQNKEYDVDVADSNYENLLTSNNNILTVFKAVQQVKAMLGEVAETVEDNFSAENRRQLSLEDICDVEVQPACCIDDENEEETCDCADPRFNNDCSPNFLYIAYQKDGK